MLHAFDIDCGPMAQGHHFVARGLAASLSDDGGISLEYELVPGVEVGPEERIFHYIVGIEYRPDVELPEEPQDGGAMAPFEGGPSTHGSRGDWPLPDGAQRLTFRIFPVETSGFQAETAAGDLTVDLTTGAATWTARP